MVTRALITGASFALLLFAGPAGEAAPDVQAAGLRIVVIAGEDAVNIIQQKTAVAPIIEVRDRNDQPVAGAVVNFAIRGGRATFGGARTLAVTTDVAGRAVAASFTPTASGAVQVSATVAFQGQTAAAVTITQTNVMTAAQAAAISSAGSSGGAASGTGAGAGGGSSGGATAGAGAGGGGGLSATTIGIIGGAAAGGALVATQVVGSATPSGLALYTGSYSGTSNVVFPPSLLFCSRTTAHAGTVQVDIEVDSGGSVTGEGGVTGTVTMASFSGAQICAITTATQPHGCCTPAPPVQGAQSSFTFRGSHGNAAVTVTYEFVGSLNGDVVTGTFTLTSQGSDGTTDRGVFPVTLQKQP